MKAARVAGIICIAAGMLVFLTPQIREAGLQMELWGLHRAEAAKETSSDFLAVRSSESEETGRHPMESSMESFESESFSGRADVKSDYSGEKDDLYLQMEAYNRKLTEEGQEIAGPEDYEQNPTGEDGAIGFISIPDMEVELPLYIGATYEHLDKGAAVLGGTSMPVGGEGSNCVISGHRSWCGAPYFRDIELLKNGSEVVIDNGKEKLNYRVFETRIILPDDTKAVMIRPGKDMVTLITCHPYLGGGTHRYVVYCERCRKEKSGEYTEKDQMAVKAAETVRNPHSEKSLQPSQQYGEPAMKENTAAKMFRTERLIRYAVMVLIAISAAAVFRKGGRNHRS